MSRPYDFAQIFAANKMDSLIKNMSAQVELTNIGAQMVPISLSDRGLIKNNYLVSPTTAYVDYAREEVYLTQALRWRASSNVIAAIIGMMRPLLHASGLDHQVQLNNWLLSTCPSPEEMEREFPKTLETLVGQYPDRAIVIRSVNVVNNRPLMNSLSDLGFWHLPARKIYLHDYRHKKIPQNVRSDRNLLRKSEFEVKPSGDFSDQDFERTAELYASLYVDKYSDLNPIYTPLFFKLASRARIIKLTGLVDQSNILQGIVGNFRHNQIDTTPIVGYNRQMPLKTGLYRMLIWLALEPSIEDGHCHNLSAGADKFKLLRGGEPTIEYSSVFMGHLPAQQRTATWMLYSLLTNFGVPILNSVQS